jgi:hypothetical protein
MNKAYRYFYKTKFQRTYVKYADVTVFTGFTDWPTQCNNKELIYKQQQVILNIRDIK